MLTIHTAPPVDETYEIQAKLTKVKMDRNVK